MDHVNRTLLLSLKQDLLSLNESIESLMIETEINSWLFPTKNYQFVKSYIQEKNIFDVNNIKIFLELIIDRLYVGIRLILTLIHDTIKTDDVRNCLILQPQQMTIGCSFENLRKLIGIMLGKMGDNNFAVSGEDCKGQDVVITTKKYGKTQTDISAMNKCDSCASATACMKNLLTLFEIHKADIYQTEQIKSSIYDLTQFGCMMQTTVTIEKSLKTLIEKLLNKEHENEELNQKIKSLNKEIHKKNGKIVLLEQECGALSEKNKKNAIEVTALKSKIENLNSVVSKSDSQIRSLNSSMTTLNSTLSIYKNESQILRLEKEYVSENFTKVLTIVKHVVKKLPILENKMSRIENEHKFILEDFSVLSKILDNVNLTLAEIAKSHNSLESKVQILYCDYTESGTNLVKNFKTFQENIQQFMIQSHIHDVKTTESAPKIQIKGNPVEDISRQIEENKERIRTLENENVKLENIVSKFKNLKK